MPPLFIAGATGYTGRALVDLACREGHKVIAHVRPGSRSGDAAVRAFEGAGATVDRTPWEEDAMAQALRAHAPQVVFALLGTTRARGKEAAAAGGPAETYQTVDRDLTLMLLRAAAGCAEPPRFVYLSSLGADTPRGNAYLQARFDVEAALRAGALPWTVARPGFITGPDRQEDRLGERLGAIVVDGGLDLLGKLGAKGLRDRFHSLDAAGLAAGLLAAGLDPDASGKILDAAALRAAGGAG